MTKLTRILALATVAFALAAAPLATNYAFAKNGADDAAGDDRGGDRGGNGGHGGSGRGGADDGGRK